MLTAISVVMHCIFFRRSRIKKSLLQKLGLLGVVSFLSHTATVLFAPLAYPGYNWMAQAVSDLNAANAPSLALWNQLSASYNVCARSSASRSSASASMGALRTGKLQIYISSVYM